MLLQDKEVAVVGGGPGGLTLARLLQLNGIDVKVYERDLNKEVRVQGATLDLHNDSGLKAIDAAGLKDVFLKTYRPGADKGRVVDKQANILYDEHGQEDTPEEDFDSPGFRPEIDRSDLRNILLESLKPNTVIWDSHLVDLAPDNGAWKLKFKNGTTANADMVIGADGARSKIRPLVTAVKPFYAGITILQGNVENAETAAPNMYGLLQDGKIYAHANGKYLHVSAKGDGSIDFYISTKRDEDWATGSGIDFTNRTQLLLWFQKEFKGWSPVWFELFENVSLPFLIRPQYCIPLDQNWEAHSNITLLGDAAHIMPPSGEGVNLAMLDALELCECFKSKDLADQRTAIATYEEGMRARAAAEAQHSLHGIEWMHAEGATEKLISMFTQINT